MPKIMDRIQDVSNKMKANPAETERIRKESVAALIGGRKSDAWKTYMKNFGTGKQLERLFGDDPEFNKSENADNILAYVVASGPCTVTTSHLAIALNMPADFKLELDDGVTGDDQG